jgi:hypothetical protein
MEVVQVIAGIVTAGEHIEQSIVLQVLDQHATGHLRQSKAGGLGNIFEASNALGGIEFRRRGDAVLRRHARRVLAQRQIRQVQLPLDLQVVRLALEIFEEIFNGCLRVGGIGKMFARILRRKNALVARILVYAVLHLRSMKVGASQYFFHRFHSGRHIGLVDGIAFLPFGDRLVHIALVGGENGEGVVILHLFHGAKIGGVGGVEELVDRIGQYRYERPIVDAANACHVAIPTVGLSDRLEGRFYVHQAGSVRWKSYDVLSAQGQADRVHARPSFCGAHGRGVGGILVCLVIGFIGGLIGGLINFEDGVAGGNLHNTGELAGSQSLHGAAQFSSQAIGGKHSEQSALCRCRIRRLGFGHGREVCSSL